MKKERSAVSGQRSVKALARNPDSLPLRLKAASTQSLTTGHRPPPTVLIIGHRGAAAVAPENTLVSFERALLDGADGIEFDVRLARDGVPVVIHDSTLRRTALRNGRVASFSSTELSEMDAGSWFNLRHPVKAHSLYAEARIPSLAAVFASLQNSDTLLYVEMKCGMRDRSKLAAEVVKLVDAHGIASRVRVESFDLAAITEVKRLDADLRTTALFDRRLTHPAPSARKMIERAIRCGAEEIALHHTLATLRTVAEATQRGLETVVWTADNPAWVARAVKLGVRAIITNDPARLIEKRRLPDGQ
jgi:glycerophosphoryl diester phosphodiesterase